MTKEDRRRAKRRFLQCVAIGALCAISTIAVAAQYPERCFSKQPEAELVAASSEVTATIAVTNSPHITPEIVLEVEDTYLDAPIAGLVEVTPEPISEPTTTEPAPLSYAAPPDDPEPSVDRELLACVIEAEAGNQSLEGRIGVGNVVMQRVASAHYPDNVYDVLYQYDARYGGWQFSTAPLLASTTPSELSYEAADAALASESVLPESKDGKLVVFFSRAGENSDVAITIGDHVFCYAYQPEP